MGDGYTADPDQLRGYAQQVDGMASGISEGQDAADHIMTTNSIDQGKSSAREYLLSKVGLHDSGRLDLAYGVICQPVGMVMEDIQQAVADAIGHVVDLMAALSQGLRDSATRYTEDDVRGAGLISDAGNDLDDALIPVPNRDTSVHTKPHDVGGLPPVARIPVPDLDTSVAPAPSGPTGPLPRLAPIPEVRRHG